MQHLRETLPELFTQPLTKVGIQPSTMLYIGASIAHATCAQALHDAGHELTLLEIWPANADHYRGGDLFAQVVCGDVRQVDELIHGHYDVIFWRHGPEHVDRMEAAVVVRKLEAIATRLVILGCPSGEYKQGAVGGNPHERHVSQWCPADFEAWDYQVNVMRPGRRHLLAWKYIMGGIQHDQ